MLRALAIVLVVIAAVTAGSLWAPWRAAPPPLRLPEGGFVAPGPAARAVIWAVGDGADGSRPAREVVARMRRGPLDRLLYLGDVYGPALAGFLLGDGRAEDFRTRYATVYGALAERTAPTPGNHEWPQRGSGYEPYWRRVHGRTPPAFYEFAGAGWRVLSLNSQAPHGAGSAQLRWLRGRLRAPGTCRLAFWHRPRFSAGRHGDAPDLAPLWDALRGHAVLVVSGHDHNMQRLRPIGGITQLVSGAGGHSLYELRPDRRLAFGADEHYGALRIELRPGRAALTFVSASGLRLDRSAVRCRRIG